MCPRNTVFNSAVYLPTVHDVYFDIKQSKLTPILRTNDGTELTNPEDQNMERILLFPHLRTIYYWMKKVVILPVLLDVTRKDTNFEYIFTFFIYINAMFQYPGSVAD